MIDKTQVKTFSIFYRDDNLKAKEWQQKILKFSREKFSEWRVDDKKPDVVIALGGDGTILQAARQYGNLGAVIAGFNLGTTGFLASVRDSKKFLGAIENFFSGKYGLVERTMIGAKVFRNEQIVHETESLNDFSLQNFLGMVDLDVFIEGFAVQKIRGTGVLVSTATGSTAFNLSAHGPIVMPSLKCMIVTEILDHNVPTPSMVVGSENKIEINVLSFRKRDHAEEGCADLPDVALVSDGGRVFELHAGDKILITTTNDSIKFAEFEKNYFFKSLHEKFWFR
ncbi:MAG: NAD(+)/NADH kinase [Candidatus Paceibacterota bacterium]|jgi:NAD+ kinase